jgi:hypothetical protein
MSRDYEYIVQAGVEICESEEFDERERSLVRGWRRCHIGKGIDESGLSVHSEQEWRSLSQRSLMRGKRICRVTGGDFSVFGIVRTISTVSTRQKRSMVHESHVNLIKRIEARGRWN